MKVAVLMGGRSAEREISLRSGQGIAAALRNLGHDVTSVDGADGRVLPAGDEESAAPKREAILKLPLSAMLSALQTPAVLESDVVFIALHGTYGEDGTVQAALELAGKVYTGSGVLASAVAMDKAMTKRVFEREALPTPHWMVIEAGVMGRALDVKLLGGYPLVVKPNAEGSTLGLTIVRHPSEFEPAIHKAAEHDTQVLVEQFIEGRELTVAVIGEQAFPVVEIRPKSGFYDYAAKYTKGATEYDCPADLDKELAKHVRELATESCQVLGCRGAARVDLILNDADEPYILEVNTIPGMTPTSLVPMAAKAKGLSYDQLVGRMLDLAVADAKTRRNFEAHKV
ncbi:MAG: D-alanine--D-alanine ligase [Candidatus Eisenbacteria bacterium]